MGICMDPTWRLMSSGTEQHSACNRMERVCPLFLLQARWAVKGTEVFWGGVVRLQLSIQLQPVVAGMWALHLKPESRLAKSRPTRFGLVGCPLQQWAFLANNFFQPRQIICVYCAYCWCTYWVYQLDISTVWRAKQRAPHRCSIPHKDCYVHLRCEQPFTCSMYCRTGYYWLSIILNRQKMNFYLINGRSYQINKHRRW